MIKHSSVFALILFIEFILFLFFSFTELNKNKKRYIFFCVTTLSITAFFFNPIKAWELKGNYTDLYRFYQDLYFFRNYSYFGNELLFKTDYSLIPVIRWLIKFVAITHINGLLPFISSMLSYGIFGFVIYKVSEKYEVDSKKTALIFFIFISLINYKITITNIRMPIGMSIMFLTYYNDIFKNKRLSLCLLGYIICCCIHSVFYLFVIFRILLFLFNKYSIKILYFLLVISSMFLGFFTSKINLFNSNPLISSILYKIGFYTEGMGSTIDNFELNVFLLGILKIVILLILIYEASHILKRNKKLKYEVVFCRLTMIFLFFSLGSTWNFHLFHRMTNFLTYFICFWYLLLNSFYSKSIYKNNGIYEYGISVNTILLSIIVILHLYYFFMSYQYGVLTF